MTDTIPSRALLPFSVLVSPSIFLRVRALALASKRLSTFLDDARYVAHIHHHQLRHSDPLCLFVMVARAGRAAHPIDDQRPVLIST